MNEGAEVQCGGLEGLVEGWKGSPRSKGWRAAWGEAWLAGLEQPLVALLLLLRAKPSKCHFSPSPSSLLPPPTKARVGASSS